MDEHVRDYVNGLPDVSGTFTGTFSTDVDVAELFGPVPDLMPIEIDTGDEPNPAVILASTLTIKIGDRELVLPIAYRDLLGGNRVRVWVRRPAHQPAHQFQPVE